MPESLLASESASARKLERILGGNSSLAGLVGSDLYDVSWRTVDVISTVAVGLAMCEFELVFVLFAVMLLSFEVKLFTLLFVPVLMMESSGGVEPVFSRSE